MLFADDGIRHLKQLYVNILALFLPQRLQRLKDTRKELSREVRLLVDEFGPLLFEDFEEKRIITPKEHRNCSSIHELLSDGFGVLDEIGV